LPFVGGIRIEDAHGIANRRERIAQLVGQRGQELVLAPVGLEQGTLRVLETADVEVDARPALDASGLVADGHALREDRVIFPIDAHHAVFAIPAAVGERHSFHAAIVSRGHQ
jgi:hypothetical protein